MANHAPDTYQAILDADRESQQRFSGHGSAIAQVYNHMIMPLANAATSRRRSSGASAISSTAFTRDPEGMWLAETAVDLERSKCSPPTASSSPSSLPRRPSQSGAIGTATVQERRGRQDRSHPPLRLQSPFGPQHQPVLLRRPHLPRRRVRRAALQRRTFRQPPHQRLCREPPLAATHAHRHRRRNLRPSSLQGRDGALLRAASHRDQQARQAHQLRRIPHHQPADSRSRDPREHCLELLPRRGTLEHRLRLQLRRQAWLEPVMARAAAQGARLPARQPARALRN